MTVVDLHPEDLLDREARGELGAAELERLERHVAQCKPCLLERQARADFRLEDGGGPEVDVQRLLSDVFTPGASRARTHDVQRSRPAGRRLRPAVLIAATLLVATASAAAGWRGLRSAGAHDAPSPAVAISQPPPPARAPVRAGSPVAAHVVEPREITVDVTAPSPAPPLATTEPRPTAVIQVASPRVSTRMTVPTLSAAPPLVTVDAPAAALPTAPPVDDAAALFDRANRARRSGDHARASDVYRALVERYPASAEAHESQAVLGRLLLGDGQANAALRYFDEYLRTGGALAEDVMADRAQALARLGRVHDEADAWGALLRAYPSSVHSDRALGRLGELGAP